VSARLRVLGSVFALALALACGKKGPPLPPYKPDPQPAGAVKAWQQGSNLAVSFQAARTTVEGRPLDVHEVEVVVADRAGDLAKVGTVYRFHVAPGEVRTELVPLPAPGSSVRVGVRSRAGGVRAPIASIFTLTVHEPPATPAGITAKNDPAGVLLTWPTVPPTPVPTAPPTPRPVAPVAPGAILAATPVPTPTPAPIAGYQIRRRPPTGAAVLLSEKPIAGPPFLDETALGSGRFCYTVRRVIVAEPVIASADSPEGCVDVKDVRPPQPPVGLTAQPRNGGFELAWSPSPDADVTVYRVYRAATGTMPQKLAEKPAAERTYVDASAPARGTAYRFTVTAVDAAGNESSPSSPAEAALP